MLPNDYDTRKEDVYWKDHLDKIHSAKVTKVTNTYNTGRLTQITYYCPAPACQENNSTRIWTSTGSWNWH